MSECVLIVDDDPVQRRLLENMVRRLGYEVLLADNGEAAMRLLSGGERPVDCVVLDLVMPDLDGLGVLTRMRETGIAVPVIVQTAHGGIDNVISAMRAGAADFVVKPVGAERLQVSLRNALAASALAGELRRIKRSQSGTLTFADIVTRSPLMAAVIRNAGKAAASGIPVLIEGESGVGKEIIARAIHGSGERRTKPFVAVNCGAIPDNLVESILFGHEKGAFTGATEPHAGKFAEAAGGTLFLDEVGELPAAAQVKLLRAVQDGEIEPVGGRRTVKTDVRLISATNRNLIADVKAGRFREDLFYRLHVFPVSVPPLRERLEDVPGLARHFLARFCAEEGKPLRGITAEARARRCADPWARKVRPLEHKIFRAVVLAEGPMIGVSEFPQLAAFHAGRDQAGPNHAGQDQAGQDGSGPEIEQPVLAAAEVPTAPSAGEAFPLVPVLAPDQMALLDLEGHVRPLDELEKELIRFAINHYRGQMSEVARRLQIGRSTLYRKLESLGLSESGRKSDAASVAQG